MSTPTIPITLDLAATLSGTIPVTNLPVGPGSDQVAAGNDPRLTTAPRVVGTITDLLATTPPVQGVDSGFVLVQGYYSPADGGGGLFQWDPTATGKITSLICRSEYKLGSGYDPNNPPTITISAPDDPNGTQATATCTVKDTIQLHSIFAHGVINKVTVNPGSGYLKPPQVTVSPGPTGPEARPAELFAFGTEFDNGGTVFARPGHALTGRWRRVDHDRMVADGRHFGIKLDLADAVTADFNSAQLANARESLPFQFLAPIDGPATVPCGAAYLDCPLFARTGTLRLPTGNFYIGSTLHITPYMNLESPGTTVLNAKPGFAADVTTFGRKQILRLAINCVYSYNAVWPSDPLPAISDTYQSVWSGHIKVVGNRDPDANPPVNPDIQGIQYLGAQNCVCHGELEAGGCGPGGQIITTVNCDTLTCLGGVAPGVIIWPGSVGNRYGTIDCEHLIDAGDGPQGAPQACILVSNTVSTSIGYVAGETAVNVPNQSSACHLQFKGFSSSGIQIGNMSCNGMANYIVLRGECLGFCVGGMTAVNNNAPGGGYWIDDDTSAAVADNNNQPVRLPAFTPSYRQALRVSGQVDAGSLAVATDRLTAAGMPVITRTFLYGGVSADRVRLRWDGVMPNNYPVILGPFLVHLTYADGTHATGIFTANKPSQAFVQTDFTVLSGGNLLVTTSGLSTFTLDAGLNEYRYHPSATFSLSAPGIGISRFAVFSLGDTALIGIPGETSSTWKFEPEDNNAVKNGTATGTLNALALNAAGRLPVNAVALHHLFTAASSKTAAYTLTASDPDIEADATSNGFTLTLHDAAGNAGLVRTISNSGTSNLVTVAAPSGSPFSDGSPSKTIPPGSSLRLKVNAAGRAFLIL